MTILQVCTSGYVIKQCGCPLNHGRPAVLKCTGSCPLLFHREINYRPELLDEL